MKRIMALDILQRIQYDGESAFEMVALSDTSTPERRTREVDVFAKKEMKKERGL